MRILAWTFCLVLVLSTGQSAQPGLPRRAVAITVDDLPYARGGLPTPNDSEVRRTAEIVNRSLLAAFEAHHVPVTGFVIQKDVESLGPTIGTRILREWIAHGFDLGNHTYSHPDINELSPEQIEQEILVADSGIRPLMAQVGKKVSFFRFPFNHTGDTKLKHDEIAAFLAQNGDRVATCTIDTSDYIFNTAYIRMLANNDATSARRLRDEYLAYTSTEIDYYAGLNKHGRQRKPSRIIEGADRVSQVQTS